jgi:iron complex transport system substrate-binding protein
VALAALLVAGFCLACQTDKPAPVTPKSTHAPLLGRADSAAGQTTFTCQAPVPRWAKRFRANCQDGILYLTALEAWKNRGGSTTYALLPSDTTGLRAGSSTSSALLAPLPKPQGDTVYVRRDPRRIAALVGAQIGYLDALRALHRVKAVSRRAYVYAPTLLAGLDAKQVHEVGDISQASPEALASLRLDAVWHTGGSAQGANTPERLHGLGIASIEGGEWMENHPLGRAEWILFYGALIDALPQADSIFRKIEKDYVQTRDGLQALPQAKTAFNGAPWQGIWHVPGGRSYAARLVQDAGLTYLWADDTTEGSLPLSPEAVMTRARDADLWLDPGSFTELNQAAQIDSRFAALKAFRHGEVYAHDARMLPNGADDYWESGIVFPDRLLLDLANLARGDTSKLRYWRRLPRKAGS